MTVYHSQLRTIPAAYSKPSGCTGCALETLGNGFSIAEGSGLNGVLCLGEALGENECRDGLPFRPYAQAGAVLERAFKACGYPTQLSQDRSRRVATPFGLYNVIACQPPNNKLLGKPYEYPALSHCRVHLREVISYYKPRCILALGGTPLKSLTGLTGKRQSIEHLRGFALESPEFPSIPIVPTYHPAYIARGASNVFPVLCRDIKYAVNIAKNGFYPREVNYYEHAGLPELDYLIEQCSTDEEIVQSIDFETEGNVNAYEDEQLMTMLEELYGESRAKKKTKRQRERLTTEQRITQLNVSIKEGESFVFQWTPEIEDKARVLLGLNNTKTTHNGWAFDMQVADYNKLPWGGVTHDTMIMFHCLYPDIPGRRGKMDESEDGSFANLQYCASFYGFDRPWKHLVAERPEWYGGNDSDADLRLFNGLIPDMKAIKYGTNGPSVWDSYNRLYRQLWPVLRDASKRGMPVNRVKILRFLDSVVKRQWDVGREIQSLIPSDLLPSKHKKGLAKAPKDTTGYVIKDFRLEAEEKRCKCFRVRKMDTYKWANVIGAEISEKDGKLRAPDPICPQCGGLGSISLPERTESRWCKLEPFNPNSPVQMKKYAAYKRHKIPKNKDGEYAMDKWTLDQMARTTRDPLYRNTINYRQFEKMSAYAVGWMPRDDGNVHPEFSYYPATMQLSSFNPNAQNAPSLSKYGPLAVEFRDAVEAPPGHKIIELDLKSFHVQTLGFEAGCPEYIRLGKIDIHSYIACVMLKVPHVDEALDWSDEELRAWLKWYRKNYTCPDGTPFQKVRDERAKVGILAFGLGQQASSLFTSNRDNFLPDWYTQARDNNVVLLDRQHRTADKEGLKAAQLVHDAINERFPKVKQFRDTTPLLAKRGGNKVVSRFGCVRWFWDIEHWDSRRREMVHGTDWEKAIAFPVQNSAHGYLRESLLRMELLGYLEIYGFVNTVHDSLVFVCRDQLVENCIHDVKEELERPSEVLVFNDGTGLSVEAEAKVGNTWGRMEEI